MLLKVTVTIITDCFGHDNGQNLVWSTVSSSSLQLKWSKRHSISLKCHNTLWFPEVERRILVFLSLGSFFYPQRILWVDCAANSGKLYLSPVTFISVLSCCVLIQCTWSLIRLFSGFVTHSAHFWATEKQQINKNMKIQHKNMPSGRISQASHTVKPNISVLSCVYLWNKCESRRSEFHFLVQRIRFLQQFSLAALESRRKEHSH